MSVQSPLREVYDDVRTELRERRAQVMAALTYLVLASGALMLFSSLGEDSRQWYDAVDRTTLAYAAIVILAVSLPLAALTLVVDRSVRRAIRPGALPRHLKSRRSVFIAMAVAVALIVTAIALLATWPPPPTLPAPPTTLY